MSMATIRRLAANILNVGERRIWINPGEVEEVKKMATRADVRDLISKGTVKKLPVKGRKKVEKKKRRGKGSKKGTTSGEQKKRWMEKVRAQRRLFAAMVSSGALDQEKRRIYSRIKSGLFRNKKAMLIYLKENKLIAADYEEVRPKPVKKEKVPKAPKKAAQKKPVKKEGESK
ncbi:MAG: 50S ribosomal protein L19e [Candidatus Micrarchaeota archaeon]